MDRRPRWSFDPEHPTEGERGDWSVALYRTDESQPQLVRGETKQLGPDKEWVWTSDYGLIVRGPHPRHPGRMVLIMAGAHSLGSGAACLAATRSSIIKRIRERLPKGILEDKQRTFWALIKGTVTSRDYLLDEDGVSVEEAGVY